MSAFQSLKDGSGILIESIRLFARQPKLLVPLLTVWLLYAPTILYLQYFVNWDAFSFSTGCLIVFGVIYFFAVLLTSSCTLLLELLHQLEDTGTVSVGRAFHEFITKDLYKILPIAFLWAIVWFLLALIQAIFSRKKNSSSEDTSFTAENAAKTLAGYRSFSLSAAFFQALQKNVRMVVFLILPAIAWEDLGVTDSIKKGFAVLRTNLAGFVSGFLLTESVSIVLFFPIALLFGVLDESDIVLPTIAWVTVYIYIAFAWSFSFYVEQMYTAELYMWHMRWQEAVIRAEKENKEIPTLSQIARPSVLDEFPDFQFQADIDNLVPKRAT